MQEGRPPPRVVGSSPLVQLDARHHIDLDRMKHVRADSFPDGSRSERSRDVVRERVGIDPTPDIPRVEDDDGPSR